jgi:hypothetical protein
MAAELVSFEQERGLCWADRHEPVLIDGLRRSET